MIGKFRDVINVAHTRVTGSYSDNFVIGLTAVKGRWRTTWGAPNMTSAKI